MRRNHRFLTAVFTVIALLFAQLAVAAYACPELTPQAAPAMSESASHCDQLDARLKNLCQKHCHGVEQSQPGPATPAAFVAVPIAVWEPPRQALPIAHPGHPALFHAISPPLTIRNCCFRI
ncbi:MAG TPA: hypothetical protein VM122_06820 [Usitatibacter sp.]|nr:hypothetical protein [Usitatibacter sp.]